MRKLKIPSSKKDLPDVQKISKKARTVEENKVMSRQALSILNTEDRRKL